MLATSKVLHTLSVPFTYINNCETESEQFRVEFDRFYRAARVVKTLKTMRIGQLGGRIDFFWSTIASEIELLRRFGVQVIPIDMADLLVRVKDRTLSNAKAYRAELAELQKRIEFRGYAEPDGALPNLGFRDELLDLGNALALDGFSIQSFSSIQNILGTATALAQAQIADAGYPVAPESDVHGVISSLLLEAASGTDDPAFLADITTRHPDNDNAVLLWHVDAPLSLADPASKLAVGTPWILKGLPSGHLHFKLKDGPLTFCRFDGDGQTYRLGVGEGRTVAGPYTQEFYAWMEVDRWETLERQLIYGPYIHHTSFAYDRCTDVLHEASRYIPGLEWERLG
jgi:L-fucose isomerase-like protein